MAERTVHLVRNRKDRVNVGRALVGPVIFFWPLMFGLAGTVEIALYAVVLLLVVVDMNYVLHLHVHRPFTTSRTMNVVLDLCLGSVTGMTSANWRIQHVHGHHQGHDAEFTSRRLEWTLERYSLAGAVCYSVGNSPLTYWRPIAASYRNGVRDRVTEPIDYRWAFVEQVGFILFVVALGVINPMFTFMFVLPWYCVVFMMTRYVDYLNHYGCGAGAFDCANNSLNRSFNRRIHNFGFHTAHHHYPTAHWTELPQLHEELKARIPDVHLKSFSWSSAFLAYHGYRAHDSRM